MKIKTALCGVAWVATATQLPKKLTSGITGMTVLGPPISWGGCQASGWLNGGPERWCLYLMAIVQQY